MAVKCLNIRRIKQFKIPALIVCLLIVIIFIYFPNYAKLRKLRYENKRLISENQELEREIADYQDKLKKIGKDPYIYEKIVRDQLGVAKENEIVIDIEQ